MLKPHVHRLIISNLRRKKIYYYLTIANTVYSKSFINSIFKKYGPITPSVLNSHQRLSLCRRKCVSWFIRQFFLLHIQQIYLLTYPPISKCHSPEQIIFNKVLSNWQIKVYANNSYKQLLNCKLMHFQLVIT